MTPGIDENGSVVLTHERGCKVVIHLPAPMELVAETLIALAPLGYIVPAAVGAKTMNVEFAIPAHYEDDEDGDDSAFSHGAPDV